MHACELGNVSEKNVGTFANEESTTNTHKMTLETTVALRLMILLESGWGGQFFFPLRVSLRY